MKFHLVAAVTLLASTALGCAEEEVDARDPAYPVGYTIPRRESPGAAGEAMPAARAQQAEQAEHEAAPAGPAVEQAAGAKDEVAVGADPEQSGAELVDNDPSALTDFHGTLDPYGTWMEDASYGTVWVPSPTVVGPHFTPYVTSGRWAYDDDYVWVSDYEWGWAPFHYGRWVYGGGVGWEWIPGRRYAGA
ncbi:MAG: hypothetical protein M3O36_12450, partial [Myxococcota bacterium]|nr:hypothetical protein [Myxococcota bacterium]